MKRSKYIRNCLASVFFLTMLLCYVVHLTLYHKTKIKAYDIFKEVVYMDIDERKKQERIIVKTIKGQQSNADSITIQRDGKVISQKKRLTSKALNQYCIIQRYLSAHKPIKIQVLDSMFYVALQRAGIPAQTAVKCSVVNGLNKSENAVTYSRDVSTGTYFSLPVFTMEEPTHHFTMSLQGFIRCSWNYLLKEALPIPYVWFLVLVYIGSLSWIIRRSLNKIKLLSINESSGMSADNPGLSKVQLGVDMESVNDKGVLQSQNSENETLDIITPIQQPPREWLSIADHILFDEKTGEIKYNDEFVLQLKGLNLKLFAVFVKGKDSCIEYDSLKIGVWENHDLDNRTVSLQINRLSKELQDKIEILSIENIRGKGYRLIINKLSNEQSTEDYTQ